MNDPLAAPQPDAVLQSLNTARTGMVYDLSSGWWRGMPGIELHPRFDVITYRSPQGVRNQNDIPMLRPENNEVGYNFMSELVMGTTHTGTHIDAICHITCGPDDEWFGGVPAKENIGDLGALQKDASEFPPFIRRGIHFDIPGLLGADHVPAHTPIGPDELQAASERQGFEVREGDVANIRTGQMRYWPDEAAMAQAFGAGVSLAGAEWLVERGVTVVGADTAFIEVEPSGIPGSPQPVHVFLIQQRGIPIIEWISSEELARDGVSEFVFVCLPLTIKGASGSMIRPIAIA